ncbi:MAG: EAL domain-containing protein [Ruminococcus sp.]|nr:EAL domain-containing protein [Ruminococcus sp.]
MERNAENFSSSVSFSKLALALANDYESIYVVDSVSDSYVEYSASGSSSDGIGGKELSIISGGDDFFSDLRKNTEILVYKEDRERFIKAFNKQSVTEKLKNGRSFSLSYRLLINGEPCYYYLKTIRTDSGSIIIGVQNVDEQKKREFAAEETSRTYSEIAASLASLFEVIYHIDINTDHYTQYSSSESFARLGLRKSGENFFGRVAPIANSIIHPDDREKIIRAFGKKTLLKKLEKSASFSISCRLFVEKKLHYVDMLVFRNRKDTGRIVLGIRNIDEQKRLEAESETYEQIAAALASRYEAIYYINIDTNEYSMYSSSDLYSELGLTKQGNDFFADAEADIQSFIHKDDIPLILEEMKKENLLKKLEASGSISLEYRQQLGKNTQYVNNFIVRPSNDRHHIIMGISNIDERVKLESFGETYSQIAGALASRYEAIYYVNTDTNEYTRYLPSDTYAKLGLTKQGNDFFADTAEDIPKCIYIEDRPRMLSEMGKERLMANLEATGSLSLNYRQQLDDRLQYLNLLAVRPKNDKHHIVMGVTNIDLQTRREQSMKAESQTFGEIAKALAQRYEVIYHVNLLTNEYNEYSSSEKYSKLKIGVTGSDFFAETQENLKRDIYPEDQPMVAMAFKKDNIIESLRDTGKFYLNYRLIFDGVPQYVMLFAVRPKEDSSHIIVAVANVDSAKRKELEFEEAIGSAIDMANRDVLTGAKNKRAYVQEEIELDELINMHSAPAFSVVVCDINGLKQVNDNQGHKAGDEFIQSACELIRDTFTNSNVYRIGGDEFVVILKENDHEKRFSLLKTLDEKLEKHRKSGLVTVAVGVSDFDVEKDMRLQDVFERADNAMYDNKEQLKKFSSRNVSDSQNNSAEKDREFDELFKQLISAMTEINFIDVQKIEELLIKLSYNLRLCKGVTRLYRNPEEESEGKGETLCCFDTGVHGIPVHSLRVITSVMNSAEMTVFMSPDERPHSEEEYKKLDLVMRATLSFVSRNRLGDIVEELAFFDDNGYPNQRKLRNYLDHRDMRGKAVINYNLRHFSLINQEIGRAAGDTAMRNHFDNLTNIIGASGEVSRLGGDNFVAVCKLDQLDEVLDFLTETAIVYDNEDNRSVNISSSAGVFTVGENENRFNPGEAMAKSMTCLRAAQSGGKDHIIVFDNSILVRKEKSMRVQQLFPEALRNEEFHVFYQPKVNILTGELAGAEALCRWFRNGSIVPPIDFIPMLEETNDICKLDFYMLEHVCMDIRRWIDEGRDIVRISVNLSRKHMMDIDLLGRITGIVDKYDIPHKYIEIELTETTSDVEFNDLKRVVSGLQKVGIFTSVDDFGVGYSSLNLIRAIPWNGLKIDKSFIPIAADNADSSRSIMFKHVIAMAKELGLECIAEGVETEQQLEIMQENGCDFAQGFFYDKPIPYEEFIKRLECKFYPTSS